MIIHNPILTGSFTVNGTDVSSITSSAASLTSLNSYTASQNILNGTYTLTSSFAAQTASFTAFTSSVNTFTASQLVLNGTYATTGSNTFAGIQTVNSNLVVTGSITAQTLVVQTITSSVDFVTGSTRFGSIADNTHQFTGSMSVSGSGTFVSSVTANSMKIEANATPTFLYFNNTAAPVSNYIALGSAANEMYFQVSGSDRMVIKSNGNIGIGTSSPSDFIDAGLGLAIISTSGRTGLSIGSTQGTANEVLGRLSFTNTNSTNIGSKRLAYISGIRGTSDNSAYLEFGTADNALGTQRMVISQTGFVGINVTPATFLHVLGANTTNRGQLCIQSNNASNAARASWYYDTTLQGNIGTTSADFYVEAVNNLQFYAGGAERMRIDTNGLITAPYMTGKSFSMTSGGGTGTAITDTGIYVGSGDWGGFGRSTMYLVTFSANPNNGGSGEYSAVHSGYITVYTGWSGSNVTTYIAYTQLVQGNNISTLTLYPTFWNGSSESASVTRGSISGWQIRIKISGYNSSFTGANQALYVQKILSNG